MSTAREVLDPARRCGVEIHAFEKRKSDAAAALAGFESQEPEDARHALDRQSRRKRTPMLKVKKGADGVTRTGPDHADTDIGCALIMKAIGTDESSFYGGLISQLVNVGTRGRLPDERGINFMLAVVSGSSRGTSSKRCSPRRWRTFATQFEALKRYRSTGEQRMRIERVTVNDGGQAIVGNVTAGERGAGEKPRTTP